MKTVIVSQRVDYLPERGETRDALDQALIRWIIDAGFLPIPLPNQLGKQQTAWLEQVAAQGVILSGGNDIGGCPARDGSEYCLLRWAERHQLPVLGICRGMQMLAVYAQITQTSAQTATRTVCESANHAVDEIPDGGDFQLAAQSCLKPVSGHVRCQHPLLANDQQQQQQSSDFFSRPVNSFHCQALAQCPSTYQVLATAADGTLEAIRHQKLPWEGWMWHPEREKFFSTAERQRLQELMS